MGTVPSAVDALDKKSSNDHKKSEVLWHRKSGAGYYLFIDYYGSQPSGIVANELDYGNMKSMSAVTSTDAKERKGMSRASKKRQKKKAKTSVCKDTSCSNSVCIYSEEVTDEQNIKECNNSLKASANPTQSSSHPLVRALISHPRCHHLSSFVNILATPLPLTLRIRQNSISSNTQEFEATVTKIHSDKIAPVSYDPSKAIYQSKTSSGLSKSNLGSKPELKTLIVNASMNGAIARQEIGSMLPVLALHHIDAIRQGSKVLDLCASPGSKTLQALEIVAQKGKGRVIANDIHPGRLDSLRDAVARSGLPDVVTSRVTFTNYDASSFPPPKSGKLFDAIICDVPCSGDGTIRKDRHILPIWTPSTGNELHSLQVKILSRAIELVKVGGFVLYSTCSLNPVEDEAVISAVMQVESEKSTVTNNGKDETKKFKLLEWPKTLLPSFIRRPGISDWKVGFYDSNKAEEGMDDYGVITFCADKSDAKEFGTTSETLWPPESHIGTELHLDRCVRILPQENDTGGFFLALIKRTR